jgi:hypothetical protein
MLVILSREFIAMSELYLIASLLAVFIYGVYEFWSMTHDC